MQEMGWVRIGRSEAMCCKQFVEGFVEGIVEGIVEGLVEEQQCGGHAAITLSSVDITTCLVGECDDKQAL